MASRPSKLCAYPLCGNLTDETYCPLHKKAKAAQQVQRNRIYDATRDKKLVAFYNSKEWIVVRHMALVRDNYLCQVCLESDRLTPATMVHHIIGIRDDWEKRLDIDNLVSVCDACHNKLHKG